ncbi:helix-turn-helix domain-containing protein [Streptomyces sp. NBC_00483]|uniref:helix-turn-helix domain-containing protein n=1 Tax=Streptomyces sp. NBC_00483 TaxID=2975756 RepID=UPI002E17A340
MCAGLHVSRHDRSRSTKGSRGDHLGTDTLAQRSLCGWVAARRTPRPDWVVARRVTLGHRIADLRRGAGLSQEQLGNLAGMDRRSIQRYENARRDPGYSDLLLIAQALRVHVTDLLV